MKVAFIAEKIIITRHRVLRIFSAMTLPSSAHESPKNVFCIYRATSAKPCNLYNMLARHKVNSRIPAIC